VERHREHVIGGQAEVARRADHERGSLPAIVDAHATLGISIDSTKFPLGLVESSSANTTVVTDLLTGVRDRGVDVTRPVLLIIRRQGPRGGGARRVRPAGEPTLPRASCGAADYVDLRTSS
jgi:hypothetical protein